MNTKKLKTIKEKVEKLLKNEPHLRDDDNKLISNFYFFEVGKNTINQMSAMDFLKLLSTGNLTAPETIRRCRQKLQEENPSLRGELFNKRQKRGSEMSFEIVKTKLS
jgi:hypothetical protein